jgi:hypothetical protein
VGDSLHDDVGGAMAAGLVPVHFAPDGASHPGGRAAPGQDGVPTVSRLQDLLSLF